MALPALRAGLGLGRSYATRMASHGGAATGRRFSSGAGGGTSFGVAARVAAFCINVACAVVVVDHFKTMGENVEKIRVAMDQLVEHQTKPPVVPSHAGNAAGAGAAGIAKPTS